MSIGAYKRAENPIRSRKKKSEVKQKTADEAFQLVSTWILRPVNRTRSLT